MKPDYLIIAKEHGARILRRKEDKEGNWIDYEFMITTEQLTAYSDCIASLARKEQRESDANIPSTIWPTPDQHVIVEGLRNAIRNNTGD